MERGIGAQNQKSQEPPLTPGRAAFRFLFRLFPAALAERRAPTPASSSERLPAPATFQSRAPLKAAAVFAQAFAVLCALLLMPAQTLAQNATGAPEISGTVQVGETLTASTTNIADPDGLTNPGYTYQWIRVNTNIGGATSSTYMLVTADKDKKIKVRVTFTDDGGSTESLTSAETVTVTENAAPSFSADTFDAAENQTSVGTVEATDADSQDSVTGYALTGGVDQAKFSITPSGGVLTFQAAPDFESPGDVVSTSPSNDAENNEYVLEVTATSGAGSRARTTEQPITVTVTNVNEDPTGAPEISGTVQVGETLTASTTNIADPDGLTNPGYTYQWIRVNTNIGGATSSTYMLVTADKDKKIKVRVTFTDDGGSTESLTSAETVTVTENAAPSFSADTFDAAENQTSVGTVEATDADSQDSVTGYALTGGVDQAKFSITPSGGVLTFQAAPDFESPGDVVSTSPSNDAENNEYVLEVTATSGAGSRARTTEQPITVTVTNVNEDPTGAPEISGTVQVGETLTASTTNIADPDGLTNPGYTYQWIRVNTNIGGATSSTYMLVTADKDKKIKVRVTFTDDGGSTESLTSAETTAVETVPDAPSNLLADGTNKAVTLAWDPPEDDGGAAITDYEYRINVTGRWISIGSTDTTHTVTGLVNGTEYVFEVRAVNRIGGSRASNRAVATTLAVLDFTHFANGAGITSDFVFVNMGTHPMRPALYFYDQGGALIDPESVVDVMGNDLEIREDGSLTVWGEMEPLEERTIATHGQGELVSGSVRVVSDGPIGGFVRYSVPGVGVAGVGTSRPVWDALFPVRRQERGIRTAIALHNLKEEAIVVSCRLMQEGAVLQETEIALEANGQTSWFIDEAFPAADTSDFLGSVRCTTPGGERFTGLAVEIDAAKRIFTTLAVVPVDRVSGGKETVLDFAHFANGAGITSGLVFVNMKTQPSGPAPNPFVVAIPPIRPAIYFYDTEGHPIDPASVVDLTGDLEVREDGSLTVRAEMEPLGVLTIATHGRGELVSGSVKVVSSGPLGGMLRYHLPEVGVGVAGSSPAVRDALFPVRRQEGGITTRIALHNLESRLGLVRCELLREGVLLDAVSIPLEANGQTSWLIDQAFPAADTSNFVGAVRCGAVGEGRFTAVALEMDPGTRTFITLPVFPLPERPDRE